MIAKGTYNCMRFNHSQSEFLSVKKLFNRTIKYLDINSLKAYKVKLLHSFIKSVNISLKLFIRKFSSNVEK